MSSAAIRNCILAALLVAVPATAETFYNQDGVVFEGTLRRVVSNASVCNVLEENHTPEEYERLKGNQGQPLHLWQVDYTVRNESGRLLEYLRASSWVRSEHPPCTNWSGEGPGGGSVLPEPSLPIPMYWGDYDQLLQMPYGMRPGQQVRRAYYLEVFHEHQPRFGEWDIDYTFATDAARDVGGAKRGGDRPDRQAGSSKAAGQLPPEIQMDLNLRKAEQAVRDGDAATVREAMERLEALEQEHGLEPSPEDHYRYAQAWAAAGEPERAMAAAVRYLQAGGREAEHYTEALDLINREGALAAAPAAGNVSASRVGPGPEPTCAGQEQGTSCWMELASHPGCYVWNPSLGENETAAWSGGCSGGLAHDTGTLVFNNSEGTQECTGLLQGGKMHGQWVVRDPDGGSMEGPTVDGKMHGRWVLRRANGIVEEGPYVEGKRHGHWVKRYRTGIVDEGPYVDGMRHGHWVTRYPNGTVEEGQYVDHWKHGDWVTHYPNGNTTTQTWINGIPQ